MTSPGVLLTRPAGQADGLREGLQAQGWRVFHQPLIEIEPAVSLNPQQRRLVLELDQYQHVIFVSRNAISYGMTALEDYWPQLPMGVLWYAIGSASAAQLSGHGVDVLVPVGAMNSEGLLARPELKSLSGQRVLIMKGVGGRTLLADELTRREGRVDTLATYRRCCPALTSGALAAQLEQNEISIVSISSGEGLHNMVSLLGAKAPHYQARMRLVVPGARVAAEAQAAGFARVIAADNATDAAMLTALREQLGNGG
jgi:uroporphyrinogen-III synthase